MKSAPRPLPGWLQWLCLIIGALLIVGSLYLTYILVMAAIPVVHTYLGPKGHATPDKVWMSIFGMLAGKLVGQILLFVLGIWLVLRSMVKDSGEAVIADAGALPSIKVEKPAAASFSAPVKKGHWSAYNVLHLAPDAKRIWRFEAKGKGLALTREQRVPHAEPLPASWVAKSWGSLFQPKLNIAWLPAESVFLRVVELPAANAEETFSMVELQLEKLSPVPVTQTVWTMHVLGTYQSAAKADGTKESLQSVIVIIAGRAVVEEFMGRLERDGFLSDRLEVPMLDQLEAVAPKEDSIWVFPLTIGGQNAALVAWWFGHAWRNLSFVTLPPAGDRATELKTQLSLLAMAGEVEGWLTAQPRWHLVADPVNATEWEQLLRNGLNEPVQVTAPPAPVDLAARSATRAANSTARVQLQPEEFAARYKEQFFDRLWLHGLGYVGLLYAIAVVIFFCGAAWTGYQAQGVESQVAALGGAYTNAIQMKARLGVLQEREQLKFAALESWQRVAENLPVVVTLQRFGFAEGNRLTLSGQAEASDLPSVIKFNKTLHEATGPDKKQPFFNPVSEPGDQLSWRVSGDKGSWSFSLELMHAEANPQ